MKLSKLNLRDYNIPDFLGIGAQKSATSWLHAMLLHHPDLHLPPIKELHFFDTHYQKGLEWYSNSFMFSEDTPHTDSRAYQCRSREV